MWNWCVEDKTVSLNFRCLPLIDAKDEYQGLVLAFEDISREKRVKNTLVRYMARDIVEKVLEDPTQSGPWGRPQQGHHRLFRHSRLYQHDGKHEC